MGIEEREIKRRGRYRCSALLRGSVERRRLLEEEKRGEIHKGHVEAVEGSFSLPFLIIDLIIFLLFPEG